MAAGNRRELCEVCLERFDNELRQPVALTCGHSFCRPCLQNLHNMQPPLRCPNCDRIHEGEQPQDLPTNFLLLNILLERREEPDGSREPNPKKEKESCKDTDSSSDSSDSDSEAEEKLKSKYEKDKSKEEEKKKEEKKEEMVDNPKEEEHDSDKNCINIAISESPAEEKHCCKPKTKICLIGMIFILFVGVLGGIIFSKAIVPLILWNWGFRGEIVKGSYAAVLMSQEAKNKVAKEDSWVREFQRAGHKGFSTAEQTLLFFLGFLVFVGVGTAVYGVWYCCYYYKIIAVCKICYQAVKENKKQQGDVPLSQVCSVDEQRVPLTKTTSMDDHSIPPTKSTGSATESLS